MISCKTSPIRSFYLSCTPFCVWKKTTKPLKSSDIQEKGTSFFWKTVEGLRTLSTEIIHQRWSLAAMTKGEVVFLKQQVENQYKKAEREYQEAVASRYRLMRVVQKVIAVLAQVFHFRPNGQKVYQALMQQLNRNIYARMGKVFSLEALDELSKEQLIDQMTKRKLRILSLLYATGHLNSDQRYGEQGDSLLHTAVRIGDVAYIHCSPMVLLKNKEGKDPIDLALEEENYSALTAFLNRGYVLNEEQQNHLSKASGKGKSSVGDQWLQYCLENHAIKGIEYLALLKEEKIVDCLIQSCLSGYSSTLYLMLGSERLAPHLSSFSFAQKVAHTSTTRIHAFCKNLGEKGYCESADFQALYAIAKYQSKGKTNLSSNEAKNYLKADTATGDILQDEHGKLPTDYLPEGFDASWRGYFLEGVYTS